MKFLLFTILLFISSSVAFAQPEDRTFTMAFLQAEAAYDTGNFAAVVELLPDPQPHFIPVAANHYYLLAKAWKGLGETGKTRWALGNYFRLARQSHFGYQEMLLLFSHVNREISNSIPILHPPKGPKIVPSLEQTKKAELIRRQENLLKLQAKPGVEAGQ